MDKRYPGCKKDAKTHVGEHLSKKIKKFQNFCPQFSTRAVIETPKIPKDQNGPMDEPKENLLDEK